MPIHPDVIERALSYCMGSGYSHFQVYWSAGWRRQLQICADEGIVCVVRIRVHLKGNSKQRRQQKRAAIKQVQQALES